MRRKIGRCLTNAALACDIDRLAEDEYLIDDRHAIKRCIAARIEELLSAQMRHRQCSHSHAPAFLSSTSV